MGSLPVVYTHQLAGFTSNRLGSQRNTATSVRSSAITSLTVSPAARIESTFVGCGKIRERLRTLPNSRLRTSHLCKCQLIQDFAPIASAGYAVLLLGGGLFAYNKSGSKGSLFGGLTGAILMSVAYYLMQASDTKEIGDALAFGSSLLFAFIFGIRFAATRKVIPAGLLLVVSISLTALTFSAYLQDRV
ncbi:hypothetical protein L1987_72033 [Smallanthus sonchifolius]|uniref:Uncharacterized protein n=1 Tax=Smallanthus sonchifolius TaxID=185202 RepID=A0ACB9AVF6_9ASTR|nr:hypothetical protein L1987_72033 [Smallanthus sonchifolius]